MARVIALELPLKIYTPFSALELWARIKIRAPEETDCPSNEDVPGFERFTFSVEAAAAGSFQNTPLPTIPSIYPFVATSAELLGTFARSCPANTKLSFRFSLLEPIVESAIWDACTALFLIWLPAI